MGGTTLSLMLVKAAIKQVNERQLLGWRREVLNGRRKGAFLTARFEASKWQLRSGAVNYEN